MDAAASAERAVGLFLQGYSCAQAVLAACGPAFGLVEGVALRLASGLGAGLGGLRETCGAVTAMAALIGLRQGQEAPMEPRTKAALYQEIRAAIADFETAFGAHDCLALLRKASIEKAAGAAPEARTPEYHARRPCAAFVRFCALRALRG